ncbi:MAG: hypothetical protein JWN64_655 [Parcubacteria group bacterium]|nr:hypothetical protein [Parcubacteria group bacterium]
MTVSCDAEYVFISPDAIRLSERMRSLVEDVQSVLCVEVEGKNLTLRFSFERANEVGMSSVYSMTNEIFELAKILKYAEEQHRIPLDDLLEFLPSDNMTVSDMRSSLGSLNERVTNEVAGIIAHRFNESYVTVEGWKDRVEGRFLFATITLAGHGEVFGTFDNDFPFEEAAVLFDEIEK